MFINGGISEHEFIDACQTLCADVALGSIDNELEIDWHAADSYLGIGRSVPLENEIGLDALGQESSNNGHTVELCQDDADELAINHGHSPLAVKAVYHVMYSVTYRVPVLYFFFANAAGILRDANVDATYRILVPKVHQETIGNISVLGALSMVNHPIFDFPCFWIHPCRTAEAIDEMKRTVGSEQRIDAMHYLILWFSVIGQAAGLQLSKQTVARFMQPHQETDGSDTVT